ncbi:hypothetical protein K470DRAFT_268355 [Piedraia hortae CBS 480.64]|uniref:Uncharacterized protein n=1 Tax=Piedraia hortae CBS 480.64 TaxID=1314780 RepID=A0A6A7C955_9PEZI|nr:hypothetical protein K470DRAFT_268355 [Piedraia hortae CBS 480.64]
MPHKASEVSLLLLDLITAQIAHLQQLRIPSQTNRVATPQIEDAIPVIARTWREMNSVFRLHFSKHSEILHLSGALAEELARVGTGNGPSEGEDAPIGMDTEPATSASERRSASSVNGKKNTPKEENTAIPSIAKEDMPVRKRHGKASSSPVKRPRVEESKRRNWANALGEDLFGGATPLPEARCKSSSQTAEPEDHNADASERDNDKSTLQDLCYQDVAAEVAARLQAKRDRQRAEQELKRKRKRSSGPSSPPAPKKVRSIDRSSHNVFASKTPQPHARDSRGRFFKPKRAADDKMDTSA